MDPLTAKRIQSLGTTNRDGPLFSVELRFMDGSTFSPPGSIANHRAAASFDNAPLPTNAVAYSILRVPSFQGRRSSDQVLADVEKTSNSMRRVWDQADKSGPGAWRIVYCRTWGAPGILETNRNIIRAAQASGAHAVLVQPEKEMSPGKLMSVVKSLRDWQQNEPPEVGYLVDILPHVPFHGAEQDVEAVEAVANEFPVFFLDMHGANSTALAALQEVRDVVGSKHQPPWMGATQVPFKTSGPDEVLLAPVLNALGVMACVQALGGPFPGDDQGLVLADKKKWPLPTSAKLVRRNQLPAGTLTKAPQAPALDLTRDDLVDGQKDIFEVYRNHLLVQSVELAGELFHDLARGQVDGGFLQNHPEIKAIVG